MSSIGTDKYSNLPRCHIAEDKIKLIQASEQTSGAFHGTIGATTMNTPASLTTCE